MKRMWISIALLVMLAVQPAFSQDKKEDTARATATFAGGCFWCMEGPFDELDGVISTTSGYIGGHKKDPTYREVSAGTTGHAEAVQVVYDPSKVTYQKLLDVFWVNVDPTVKDLESVVSYSQHRDSILWLRCRSQGGIYQPDCLLRGGDFHRRPCRRHRRRDR